MSNDKPPTTWSETTLEFVDWDVESIIDLVWKDLGGQVSRSIIVATVVRLLRNYDDATIRLYVPVVVRRKATELLCSAADYEVEP